jgi:hypothetical protein
MEKPLSFVAAVKTFFEIPSNTAVAEFKALTTQDKLELSEMLQPIVPHEPYKPAVV